MKTFLLSVLLVVFATIIIRSLMPPESECTYRHARLNCPETMKPPPLPRTALCDPETAVKDRRCIR